jgi:hypothetical protein
VAALVVSGALPLLRRQDATSLLGAGEHALDRLDELVHLDLGLALANGEQRGLVDDVREVCSREPRRPLREVTEVHRRRERLVRRVKLEDHLAPHGIGLVDGDVSVEAAGTKERRVQDVRSVRRADDDDARADVEAVHLHEQLVEGLLALVAAAAPAVPSLAPGSIELVDEHDRRCHRAHALEQVAHARGPHADQRLDELCTGHREERHAGLPRDRLGEQRLAAPGWAE